LGIIIGTVLSLTAILNSTIEISLKIAFCAAIFVLRAEFRQVEHWSNSRDGKNWSYQRIYFIYLYRKITEKNEDNNKIELNFDTINRQTDELEYMGDSGKTELSGIAFLSEFIISLGISMAIVKYALPFFWHN
jgi:hypothetical protein